MKYTLPLQEGAGVASRRTQLVLHRVCLVITSAVSLAACGSSPLADRDEDCAEEIHQLLLKHSDEILNGRSVPLIAHAYGGFFHSGVGFEPKAVAIRWHSAAPQVLSISGITATARAVGTAPITASACGVTAQGNVQVVAGGYRVTFIAPLVGAFPRAALNDAGEVVSRTAGTGMPANYLWRGGVFVDLGSCAPVDINEHTQILCGGNGPTIWENGTATARDTLRGSPARLNNSGHVIISNRLWRAPGDVQNLFMVTTRLSDADRVVGHEGSPYDHPMLWANGSYRILPRFGRWGRAYAANDLDDVGITSECQPMSQIVVGVRARAANSWSAEYARKATGVVCNDVASAPVDINNSGAMVGTGSQGPFLWIDDTVTLLNDVLADANWRLTNVFAINAPGQILASGTNTQTGASGLVLLDPP